MRNFYLLNEDSSDIINFYRLLDEKKAVIKTCEIRCFTEDLPASKFGEFLSELLPDPSRSVSSKFDYRVGGKYHSATLDLATPVQAENEATMLRWFHLLSAATERWPAGHQCDFEVILQAFDKDDALMKTPYNLHPIPTFHNTWGAQQGTVSAKVDSFEGVFLRDVPQHMRQIWIDKMLEGIRSKEPLPFSITEAENYLEVTWNFKGDTETNEMLSSVFWHPGHDCSNDFGSYYDLYEKVDFLYEIDQLQLMAGDLDD